jgi:hypothetical protein
MALMKNKELSMDEGIRRQKGDGGNAVSIMENTALKWKRLDDYVLQKEGSVLEHTKCYSGLVSQEDHLKTWGKKNLSY